MKKSILRNLSVAGAMVASAMLPGAASAATLVFGLTGSSATSGADANSFTQTLTQNGATVKVRVTAWSMTNTSGGGTVYDSYLGKYGSGFGATSGDENGSGNTHTLDNQNRRDFLVFQFDQSVKLINGTFSPFALGSNSKDTDFTVGFGTTGHSWNTQLGLDGQSSAQLMAFFGGGLANYTGASSTNTKALNPAAAYGNVWLVGASFANPDRTIDSFKFSNLKVQTAAVPESATWMMMIVGFGAVGGAMRRKTGQIAQLT